MVAAFAAEAGRTSAGYREVSPTSGVELDQSCALGDG